MSKFSDLSISSSDFRSFPFLDESIKKLTDCEKLAENDIQELCTQVRSYIRRVIPIINVRPILNTGKSNL